MSVDDLLPLEDNETFKKLQEADITKHYAAFHRDCFAVGVNLRLTRPEYVNQIYNRKFAKQFRDEYESAVAECKKDNFTVEVTL